MEEVVGKTKQGGGRTCCPEIVVAGIVTDAPVFWQSLHSVLPRLCTASLSPAGQSSLRVRDAASGHFSRSHTQALAQKRSGARVGTERSSLLCSCQKGAYVEQPKVEPHTSGLAGRKGERTCLKTCSGGCSVQSSLREA